MLDNMIATDHMVGTWRQNSVLPWQPCVLEDLRQHCPRLLGQALISDSRDPDAGSLDMTREQSGLTLG
jgi:hypothetical protein